jgi:hypothetical protein
MDLLGMLRKLGDRLGVLELSPGPRQPSAPVKIQTRTVTLTELSMTIEVTEVRSLADLPAELSIPFDDIFKAAGIPTPPTGWTVERLGAFLNSDRIRELDRAAVQREILAALAAENVHAADIIKDAISRDQALDAFAESVDQKRRRWRIEKQKEIEALEQQIEAEDERWSSWRREKRRREQEMARTVEYLIDKPVISIDEE